MAVDKVKIQKLREILEKDSEKNVAFLIDVRDNAKEKLGLKRFKKKKDKFVEDGYYNVPMELRVKSAMFLADKLLPNLVDVGDDTKESLAALIIEKQKK